MPASVTLYSPLLKRWRHSASPRKPCSVVAGARDRQVVGRRQREVVGHRDADAEVAVEADAREQEAGLALHRRVGDLEVRARCAIGKPKNSKREFSKRTVLALPFQMILLAP